MAGDNSKITIKLPEPSLRRLPWYLAYVKLLKDRGVEYVSSTQISKDINVDASQIAKDLSFINISGKTRVGYEVESLVSVLEDFLGFTDVHKAVIFGDDLPVTVLSEILETIPYEILTSVSNRVKRVYYQD